MTRYHDSSDDSFDWSSDSAPKTKRKSPRKTKSIKRTIDDGPIKKAKKPGRKPLAKVTVLPSDPKLKRKAQNRAAQRAFRERKEQFVNELQDQMRELQEAKDKREQELAKENARLKKENERLKEENYQLKDAKFTFEFPHQRRASDKSQPDRLLVSPPHDDLLSIGSPLSEVDDDCAELSDTNGGKTSSASNSVSSLPDATFENTSLTPEFSFDPAILFCKNNLTDAPHHETDFLVQNEPLPQLFGTDMDLFGLDNTAYPELDPLFSEQMQALVELDAINNPEKPCKSKILALLGKAKGANKSMSDIKNDFINNCPDFNLDQLCEDLRRKITFDSTHILTDEDVDLYIECIKRST